MSKKSSDDKKGRKINELPRPLDELAERLLAFVPRRPSVDWQRHRGAIWRQNRWGGMLLPQERTADLTLADLHNIDRQKAAIDLNTRQFLAGHPANNVLLWGSRGTGKSSLVHALLDAYADVGLRIIEVDKHQLASLVDIAEDLRREPYRFIVFCDDLSFEADDAGYKMLKSALEGSLFKADANLLIYATSNRRHLLPEYMSDNEQAHMVGGELHQSEAVEEKISLSDRFGLWLSFYPFKQDAYLIVAEHWVGRLAAQHGVAAERICWDDRARQEALRWALARGVRSGRTAQHFARHWVGRGLIEV